MRSMPAAAQNWSGSSPVPRCGERLGAVYVDAPEACLSFINERRGPDPVADRRLMQSRVGGVVND